MIKTVAMVDDDPAVSAVVKRILEKEGFRVLTADNGRAGLDTILAERPDLVLLDVMMPVIQGYEVCRYIRSHWQLKDTKVLFISALARLSDLEWAMKVGGDDYLSKPFEVDELLHKVRRLTVSAA